MELLIKGKGLELEEAAQDYIRDKLNKLERHLPNLDEVKVEVSQQMTKAADNRYVVQVTINSHGTLLRAEERAVSINVAVDNVVDVLNRQIERLKGKLYRSQRRTASPKKEPVAGWEETIKIVKVKRFPVKSMDPEEAAEQMELLGHNFFIFLNNQNEHFSVIYKRSDGNYGLIEPSPASSEQ